MRKRARDMVLWTSRGASNRQKEAPSETFFVDCDSEQRPVGPGTVYGGGEDLHLSTRLSFRGSIVV